MPHRKWQFRLLDIIQAIEKIMNYISEMDFEDFVSDAKTVDAVIRNFTVIGEAANHIPEQFVKSNPEIPWREMADMRNIVVHEYFGVNEKIIWDTIQKDLPQILAILRDIVQKK
jgi:uncharacterized protein with HEPN domain